MNNVIDLLVRLQVLSPSWNVTSGTSGDVARRQTFSNRKETISVYTCSRVELGLDLQK